MSNERISSTELDGVVMAVRAVVRTGGNKASEATLENPTHRTSAPRFDCRSSHCYIPAHNFEVAQGHLVTMAGLTRKQGGELFRSGHHADFRITCKGHEWKVHKAIISQASDFFRIVCERDFKVRTVIDL